ncbi:hypothetical protein HanHA89_Chr01g0009231 [Helianthus annuus]|nr:hypothetical protein HanHA89_Chr01g0009231 [Helianthus annuus]
MGTIPSAAGEPSLFNLISQASATRAVSCPMPPPMPTVVVAVTTSLVSTPLPSSVIPSTLFDSPLSIFSASEKETPTVFAAHEATGTQDATLSDAGGSSSGIAEDGARLGDDLYLPTINWDPNMQDKRYQPKWKIAESSRLIFPPVIQHWVERAYPPADSAYDEKYRLENQLQAAGLRESRFVSQKNKAEDDLKRVTANLAEECIIWARDIAEKDRVRAHAKNVQEELEHRAITEAQKEPYQALAVEVEISHAKAQAKQAELEEREDQLRKLQQQCDCLVTERNKLTQSSAADQARLNEAENALE